MPVFAPERRNGGFTFSPPPNLVRAVRAVIAPQQGMYTPKAGSNQGLGSDTLCEKYMVEEPCAYCIDPGYDLILILIGGGAPQFAQTGEKKNKPVSIKRMCSDA
jgi:hypothetical protein